MIGKKAALRARGLRGNSRKFRAAALRLRLRLRRRLSGQRRPRGFEIGWNRPFAGAGNYRTPVPGLYLCGGSTHPGGNVTGLCGYNAARVIASDTAKPLWWNPPDIEAALASLPG